jgi:hypothetical protein
MTRPQICRQMLQTSPFDVQTEMYVVQPLRQNVLVAILSKLSKVTYH